MLAIAGCGRPDFDPPIFDAGPESELAIAIDRDDGQLDAFAPQGDAMGWQHLGAAYYRFRLEEEIAPDAIVQHARLRLWGRARSGDRHELSIALEDSADAAQIERGEARSLLAPRVRWMPEWSVGGWNHSPDLSPLFEALIAARGGLGEGAHVQLFVTAERGEVSVEDFSNLEMHQAELRLRTR